MRARDNRIARVRRVIDTCPVQVGVQREAYEWFRDFGELPDDDHIAYEVVQQALRGGAEQPLEEEPAIVKRMNQRRLAYRERERPGATWPPSVRAFLFDEALFEIPHNRELARRAIAIEVSYGGDVTNPGFAARHGFPTHGPVAAHVLGFPRWLIRPPYEFQGTRLLVRFDNIRSRVPQDDDRWFDEQAKAIVKFKQTGQLPDDDLHCESVLANVEFDQLAAHKSGIDVSEAMKLFDDLRWRQGDEQAEVLERICELARAGRLR